MSFETLRGRQLAPETCATVLDVSVSQVHRWISAGKITAAKLGLRCTRIDGDSVADFIISQQSVPRTPRGKAAKISNFSLDMHNHQSLTQQESALANSGCDQYATFK